VSETSASRRQHAFAPVLPDSATMSFFISHGVNIVHVECLHHGIIRALVQVPRRIIVVIFKLNSGQLFFSWRFKQNRRRPAKLQPIALAPSFLFKVSFMRRRSEKILIGKMTKNDAFFP
jgi:hypothetical protein